MNETKNRLKCGKSFVGKKKGSNFAGTNGVLAHLARARHWQCRGERFESAVLHEKANRKNFRFAFFILL